jgi:hypothetical protein
LFANRRSSLCVIVSFEVLVLKRVLV